MRSALLAAQTQSSRGHKLDSETHLAISTSRRGQKLSTSDDTMPDSVPAENVSTAELDLEATIDSAVRNDRYVVNIRLPAERRRAPRSGRPPA